MENSNKEEEALSYTPNAWRENHKLLFYVFPNTIVEQTNMYYLFVLSVDML